MSRLGSVITLLLIGAAVFFAVVAATSTGPLGGLVYFYSLMAFILAAFVIAISALRTSRRKIREAQGEPNSEGG